MPNEKSEAAAHRPKYTEGKVVTRGVLVNSAPDWPAEDPHLFLKIADDMYLLLDCVVMQHWVGKAVRITAEVVETPDDA